MMIVVITLGPMVGDLKYEFTTNPNDPGLAGIAKRKHMTYIFNTFVFMQIFNTYNCRKIGAKEFNILEGIWNNWYFLLVTIGEFFGQIAMVHYFPGITRTTNLSRTEWGGCMVIGFSPIILAPILKLTPERWLDKLNFKRLVDENKAVDTDKGIMKGWNKI